jgi:hypothetical protein
MVLMVVSRDADDAPEPVIAMMVWMKASAAGQDRGA